MTGVCKGQANGTVCGCSTENLQADPNFPVSNRAGKFKSVFLCRQFCNINLLLLSALRLIHPDATDSVLISRLTRVYGSPPVSSTDICCPSQFSAFNLQPCCLISAGFGFHRGAVWTEASGRRRCSSMFVCESWSPLLSPRPLSRCQVTRWAGSCVYLLLHVQ